MQAYISLIISKGKIDFYKQKRELKRLAKIIDLSYYSITLHGDSKSALM